jgi:hypothetical protein
MGTATVFVNQLKNFIFTNIAKTLFAINVANGVIFLSAWQKLEKCLKTSKALFSQRSV